MSESPDDCRDRSAAYAFRAANKAPIGLTGIGVSQQRIAVPDAGRSAAVLRP